MLWKQQWGRGLFVWVRRHEFAGALELLLADVPCVDPPDRLYELTMDHPVFTHDPRHLEHPKSRPPTPLREARSAPAPVAPGVSTHEEVDGVTTRHLVAPDRGCVDGLHTVDRDVETKQAHQRPFKPMPRASTPAKTKSAARIPHANACNSLTGAASSGTITLASKEGKEHDDGDKETEGKADHAHIGGKAVHAIISLVGMRISTPTGFHKCRQSLCTLTYSALAGWYWTTVSSSRQKRFLTAHISAQVAMRSKLV